MKEKQMRKLNLYFKRIIISILVMVLPAIFLQAAVPAEERAALIAFYNTANGDGWKDNSGWKTPPLDTDGFAMPGTENDWYGIKVENDHVTSISMIDNGLSGTIAPELGSLGNLEVLNLYINGLSGSIPPELGNLTNVVQLYLANNRLTGSIPPELGNMTSLTWLCLYCNLLTGSIPPEFENLHNLSEFSVSSNQLTGGIPPELGNLSNLGLLILHHNQLSGSIPIHLGKLSNLGQLMLGNNQLSGGIPSELGNLSKLNNLQLQENQLSGGIPSELGNLTQLITLYLDGNMLTGSIPSTLVNLTDLYSDWTDIGYNGVYSNDDTLRYFLSDKDPDWENTQTIAPANVSAAALSTSSIRVSWTPIIYTGDGGGYEVYYSTTSGGPWTFSGVTVDKSKTYYDVGSLNTATLYFFIVRTKTRPHGNNTNTVLSEYCQEVSAVTQSLPDTYTLKVQSSPDDGAAIAVSPQDNNGRGNGVTTFSRLYHKGTVVTLTAPAAFNGKVFSTWAIDGADYTGLSVQVTMNATHTATASYEAATSPEIVLNRSKINFGYLQGSTLPSPRTFTIGSLGGTLNWTASTDVSWLGLEPASGTGFGTVTVELSPSGMGPGIYSGIIAVSDANASNSPQTIEVTLRIYDSDSAPFGEFATPLSGATVSSSIPVTGWALDDVEVEQVLIYVENNGETSYVGSADFVEGARPDVEEAFPDYPFNYRAGWGYMMLTNFLPGGGNGTYTLHAVARSAHGVETSLGAKTIIVDNAGAVKPFGAVDTPSQGGTASGSAFRNQGWVLTPMPNTVPFDGSTIDVYVDGVNLGNPVYNVFRSDVAALFPGYANSMGAGAYFDFDTTAFENGVHSIYWVATDDAGNSDGIGSRYFVIHNAGAGSRAAASMGCLVDSAVGYHNPVEIKKGYSRYERPRRLYPDDNGIIRIETRELELLEIHLTGNTGDLTLSAGYMVVGGEWRPLPVGSTLDVTGGIFYWQPGVGFLGDYEFVFIGKYPDDEVWRKDIKVSIGPKS
jgi:hypothetical protein